MNKVVTATLAIMLVYTSALAADRPDPAITPGAIDPLVTQENIRTTICVKGYTKTIRPPAHYTNKLKKRQLRQYGYTDRNPKHYEEDHLIPLEIGGSPHDPRNLWPEPRSGEWTAKRKDKLENKLHHLVCRNRILLKDAQHDIATDWIDAYKRYVR